MSDSAVPGPSSVDTPCQFSSASGFETANPDRWPDSTNEWISNWKNGGFFIILPEDDQTVEG